jgi:hypothetical protein
LKFRGLAASGSQLLAGLPRGDLENNTPTRPPPQLHPAPPSTPRALGREQQLGLNARRAGNPTVAGPSQASGFSGAELPGRLRDARELTAVSHVAEANTGDAELLEGTAGAAIDDVAVTQTYR